MFLHLLGVAKMRVISKSTLRKFWMDPKHPHSESALLGWFQAVKHAAWGCFADVRGTFNSADQYNHLTVFDIGGNRVRVIACIRYVDSKVFIRAVLDHKEYDKGHWKNDDFGSKNKPRGSTHSTREADGQKPNKRRE